LRSPAPEAGVSTNFTIWAVSTTLPSSMARTIRSVFLTVNPRNQKNLENFTSGLQISFTVSIQGFRWVVLA
ncbi:hypothetical protein, partial [Pseudomonas sp. Sample_16]|uniref:hypothetical protein n=1 Tax=Pseudomonas sp. Sample_16 TaxID=2448263 RepID=UPI0019D5A13A